MKSMKKVGKELLSSVVIIHRLAVHDLITQNKGNIFGVTWLWLNPAIQIAIYGFVFGSGIRNNKPVGDIPFFLWLIAGFVVWTYINSVITKASRSVVTKMNLVTKMRFPVSITPAIIIISELYVHILMLITVGIILIINGVKPTSSWLYLPYFIFATTCFLYSFSLFNSSMTTMFRDYQHVVYNIMRTLFFFTPVMFVMKEMSGLMNTIMKFNPFTFLVEGYRQCLLNQKLIVLVSPRWNLYFWGVTFMFFLVGSILHIKMRKNLLDYA